MAHPFRRLPWKPILVCLIGWEVVGPQFTGYPGPVVYSGVLLYNACQSMGTVFPNLTARWSERRAAGPPPDARVVNASNALGFRFLQRLAAQHPGQNVFFSPYGVSAAMTMTATGAAGATKPALRRALGLDGVDEATVDRSYERFGTLLTYTDPRVEVLSANGLWADDQAGLRPEYSATARHAFGAGVETADLQSPRTSARIDRWIRDHTDGKISGLAPEARPDSRLVLASALVFHGEWRTRFDRKWTRDSRFFLRDGTVKMVPMMAQRGVPLEVYGRGEDFMAGRLPYGDGSFSMIVLLPDRRRYGQGDTSDNLAALLGRLSPDLWERCVTGFQPVAMVVQVPRFRFDSEPDVERVAKATGFAPAFDVRHADFRAMCTAPEGVYLARMRAKAFLEVDEEGTRAGSIVLHETREKSIAPSFRVDRPFLCAIRDDRTGLILFLGVVYDPKPE